MNDLAERSEYGQLLLRSLVRTQGALAWGLIALFAVVVLSLPILAAVLPWVAHRELAGLPLALIVLGIGVYPLLVGVAFLYIRLSERTERHFSDLVDRP